MPVAAFLAAGVAEVIFGMLGVFVAFYSLVLGHNNPTHTLYFVITQAVLGWFVFLTYVIADPIIRALCVKLRPDLTLYECPVGERSEWKDQPEHPYRVHPQWRLERIPTLVLIEDGCERGRLGEADCQDPATVEAFLGHAEV